MKNIPLSYISKIYGSVLGKIIVVRADQGYRGTFKNIFEIFHNILVDISPRIKNAFEIQPLRWIVEHTFSWFNGSKRLDKL